MNQTALMARQSISRQQARLIILSFVYSHLSSDSDTQRGK